MARKIICYGDSNTYGYDARSYMGSRFPKEVRWTGILDLETGYEIRNYGMNGREIPEDRWDLREIDDLLTQEMPLDLLVIMLGTNDLMFSFQRRIDPIISRMEGLLMRVLDSPAISGDAGKILLIAPPQLALERYGQGHLDTLARELGPAYKKLADNYGCHFADAGSWNLTLAQDGAHLIPESHRVFADHMKAILADIV